MKKQIACSISLATLLSAGLILAQFVPSQVSRVSGGLGGSEPDGTAGSPALSANGGLIAYTSSASNLVANDGNRVADVFLVNAQEGLLTRVSVNSAGIEANRDSSAASVSPVLADGFHAVAFESTSSNLSVLPNQGSFHNIFVRVPGLSFTDTVSVATARGSAEFPSGSSMSPSITVLPAPNRVLVAFASDANDLVAGDTGQRRDIFLTTLDATDLSNYSPASDLTTTRISRGAGTAEEANGDSDTPALSADGQFIAFASTATNLIATPTFGTQIFLAEIASGRTLLVSKIASGAAGNDVSSSPAISYNGRYVAFITRATDILDDVTAGRAHVVRYDSLKNSFELVNKNAAGVVGDGDAQDCKISANGRFVTFSDTSTNLVDSDGNGLGDVFVRDMETGTISRVSVSSSGGDPAGTSTKGASGTIAYNNSVGVSSFLSTANNLVAGDDSAIDVFLVQGAVAAPPLRADTILEVPPDVRVMRRRSTIKLQQFSSIIDPLTSGSLGGLVLQADGDEVRYDVRVRGEGVRRSEKRRKTLKRNQVSFRRMKPGNYNARYRVEVRRNGRVVRRSPYSPRQRFTI